jgi:hypothetical protein
MVPKCKFSMFFSIPFGIDGHRYSIQYHNNVTNILLFFAQNDKSSQKQ